MTANWPSTVPYKLQHSGFDYSRQDGVIRTDMETGQPKFRRRFTAVQKYYKGQILMTKTELAAFETWFDNTIMGGSLSFNFPDPFNDGYTFEARFQKPHSASPAGDTTDFIVKVEIDRIPA